MKTRQPYTKSGRGFAPRRCHFWKPAASEWIIQLRGSNRNTESRPSSVGWKSTDPEEAAQRQECRPLLPAAAHPRHQLTSYRPARETALLAKFGTQEAAVVAA